jgi:hypothetical protein
MVLNASIRKRFSLLLGKLHTWPTDCLLDRQNLKSEKHKMLSILRKARLKDKEMRILMLCVSPDCLRD